VLAGLPERLRAPCVALSIAAALAACGGRRTSTTPARAPVAGDTEKGIASWYGEPYHGRRAANGEIYDMNRLTAAHRTLPFGTRVRVENLDNGSSVEVRITDRGPFVDDRIIDLSRAAASEIRMIGPGLARVRLVVLEPPREGDWFAVQAGAFTRRENADEMSRKLRQRYAPVSTRRGRDGYWRVLVGAGSTEQEAGRLADRLRRDGVECLVIALETTR